MISADGNSVLMLYNGNKYNIEVKAEFVKRRVSFISVTTNDIAKFNKCYQEMIIKFGEEPIISFNESRVNWAWRISRQAVVLTLAENELSITRWRIK